MTVTLSPEEYRKLLGQKRKRKTGPRTKRAPLPKVFCAICHQSISFSDDGIHNTVEYDDLGRGITTYYHMNCVFPQLYKGEP